MFDPSEVIGGRVNRNHNLATINGERAMAYQGQTPWHQLGTRITGTNKTSVQSVMQIANLDWTVSTRPIFYVNPDATSDQRYLQVPDRKAIFRDGENVYLATVGSGYAPIQNLAGFEVLQPAIDQFGLTIESAGAIGKGERVWMLAKMPDSETIQPVEGDDVRGYMLITTAHDGTSSYVVKPTPIRVVCQNTLALSLANGRSFIRLQHKKTPSQQLDVVKSIVLQAHEMMQASNKTYAEMAARQMNIQEAADFIDACFPNPNPAEEISAKLKDRRETAMKLVYFGKGAEMAGSNPTTGSTTAWAAYNAITEYLDHVRPAEAKADSAKMKANESAIFGTGDQIKMAALQRAMQLVHA
jgi:phage/plasmid-like protein (TIGR03299 family)